MNQVFSKYELINQIKQTEYDHYGYSKEVLLDELDSIFSQINSRTFEFSIKEVDEYYLTEDLCNKLVLRKLNDNIKRLYKDEQSNRRLIITQIKTLLGETCPSWILRTDIKKFYESIQRNRILDRFKDDAMLSYQSIFLLEKLFDNEYFKTQTGLPRGMNISATLSELYMRRFDKWIQRFPGVYYYARFVDDIIIFAYSKLAIEDIQNNLQDKLSELADGLEINAEKTADFNCNHITESKPLEYLGYKFVKKSQRKDSNLTVSIAEKKVNKIKTRIIKALLDFIKSGDFELLRKRIQFLTGNYSVRKRNDGTDLRAGIFYNYSEITNKKVLHELNQFLNKAIYSRNGAFGAKLSTKLSREQKKKLSSYSFFHGFENRVFNSYTYDEMKAIVKCW
jgi:hypothetical protein